MQLYCRCSQGLCIYSDWLGLGGCTGLGACVHERFVVVVVRCKIGEGRTGSCVCVICRSAANWG